MAAKWCFKGYHFTILYGLIGTPWKVKVYMNKLFKIPESSEGCGSWMIRGAYTPSLKVQTAPELEVFLTLPIMSPEVLTSFALSHAEAFGWNEAFVLNQEDIFFQSGKGQDEGVEHCPW